MEIIALEPIKSGVAGLDAKRYGRFLARFSPKAIETEAENNASLAIVESLMEKGDCRRSPDEDAILGLLMDLINPLRSKNKHGVPGGYPATSSLLPDGIKRPETSRPFTGIRFARPGVGRSLRATQHQ